MPVSRVSCRYPGKPAQVVLPSAILLCCVEFRRPQCDGKCQEMIVDCVTVCPLKGSKGYVTQFNRLSIGFLYENIHILHRPKAS